MNGNKFIFDSNIIIYLSKGILNARKFTRAEDVPYISVITYIEVMGYHFMKKEEESFIKKFCQEAYIIPLDDQIVNKVIALRQKKKIKIPDAIIAATAIENNLQLITRNTDDFKDIPNLKLLNPFYTQKS